jgi:hypothetical protein
MSIFDPPWARNSEDTIVKLVADELRKKVCMAAAPDRSGRTCDKPKGHDGDHWTYGGDCLAWSDAGLPSAREAGSASEAPTVPDGETQE